MIKNIFIWSVFIALLYCSSSICQTKYDKSFYGGLFYLSNYIASEEFVNLKKNNSDIALVDTLYQRSLTFFDGDISEALLCLTFACLPFNKIEFKLPFGLGIAKIPLPSPPQNVFEKRKDNLPKKLYFSTPNTNFGDKDKLSHFFGNAFLKYSAGIFNFSKFMGMFVELTEEYFFANGSFDKRDLETNYYGEIFASLLKNNCKAKPSEALVINQLLLIRVGK